MKFSEQSRTVLKEMGINPEEYSVRLIRSHGQNAEIIDKLLLKFGDFNKTELTVAAFNDFINDCIGISDECLQDNAFDIFNYFRMFKDGGRFALFKYRQAEWDGPIVTLQKGDVPKSDIDKLTDGMYIYRGMSLKEFNSNKFGQSWTIELDIAKRFAFDTYQEKKRGVVARCPLKKDNVLYFSATDSESEVIILRNSITSVDKVKI